MNEFDDGDYHNDCNHYIATYDWSASPVDEIDWTSVCETCHRGFIVVFLECFRSKFRNSCSNQPIYCVDFRITWDFWYRFACRNPCLYFLKKTESRLVAPHLLFMKIPFP